MGKKRQISHFKRGMVDGARRAGLGISQRLIDWDSHAQASLGFAENGPRKRKTSVVDASGRRRQGRLFF